MSTAATSGNRNFDPTVLGLHQNQQFLLFILIFPLMGCFVLSIFTLGSHLGVYVSIGFGFLELLFFLAVGRNTASLYHFERNLRFMWSVHLGTDYINKYGHHGIQKARSLTHIKKVHKGGYIEYFFDRDRPHNWGGIIHLNTFTPDDLEAFKANVERMCVGLPDHSIIKTTLKVRSDLTDHAESIRKELGREGLPQIIRESMDEHRIMCELANEKSYENHMLVLLSYNASPEGAMHKLDIMIQTITEILEGMKIGCTRLETPEAIEDMFYGDITFNVHGLRRL